MGGDHDEVHFFAFGDADDFHRGIVAEADGAAGVYAVLLELGGYICEALFRAGDELIFVLALGENIRVAFEFGDYGGDVNQHEFGAVALGDVLRHFQGLH